MQKARSRLGPSPQPIIKTDNVKSVASADKYNSRLIFYKYISHLPALISALICWCLIYYLLIKIHPGSIKNFILPNSYFLFLATFCLANFFSWSFLFLNSRRGLILSFWLTAILFLKLQQVMFQPILILGLLTGSVMLFLVNEFFYRMQNR